MNVLLNHNILINSALWSTISELFPNFGWSYWLPRSLDAEYYDKKLLERALVVFIVWFPIAYNLLKISKLSILAVAFILYAFYLRAFTKGQTNSPKSPGNYYSIGFTIIMFVLANECNNKMCIFDNILSILLIFLGGYFINKGRYGKLKTDITGRFIFTMGFISFITNIINKDNRNDKTKTLIKIIIILSVISFIITTLKTNSYLGIKPHNEIDKK